MFEQIVRLSNRSIPITVTRGGRIKVFGISRALTPEEAADFSQKLALAAGYAQRVGETVVRRQSPFPRSFPENVVSLASLRKTA